MLCAYEPRLINPISPIDRNSARLCNGDHYGLATASGNAMINSRLARWKDG